MPTTAELHLPGVAELNGDAEHSSWRPVDLGRATRRPRCASTDRARPHRRRPPAVPGPHPPVRRREREPQDVGGAPRCAGGARGRPHRPVDRLRGRRRRHRRTPQVAPHRERGDRRQVRLRPTRRTAARPRRPSHRRRDRLRTTARGTPIRPRGRRRGDGGDDDREPQPDGQRRHREVDAARPETDRHRDRRPVRRHRPRHQVDGEPRPIRPRRSTQARRAHRRRVPGSTSPARCPEPSPTR